MARLTAVESDYKKSQAKELFIKNFSISNISEMVCVGLKTIAKWRDENDWQQEKDLNSLTPSSIRNLTLRCALAIEKGEPLPYKADDISKIVAAFDKVTDKKKVAVYTMQSFNSFSSYMLELAGKETGKKRTELLEFIQSIRPHLDAYTSQLLRND